MTFSAELAIWFCFVVPGLLFSGLSLRRAVFVLRAVHVRGALADVVDDARHVWRNGMLLWLGWGVFLISGVIAVLSPPPAAPPPTTPLGGLIVWALIAAIGIWAIMTINDYAYTARVWQRIREHEGERGEETTLLTSATRQQTVSQQLNEVQIDAISVTGDDTNQRVRNVEDAVVQSAAVAADDKAETDQRLDMLEADHP
jgi:hypothetical protein